jgi:hypothetical protein
MKMQTFFNADADANIIFFSTILNLIGNKNLMSDFVQLINGVSYTFGEAVPAGSTGQVQYNNAGVSDGASNLTVDTTDEYPIVGQSSSLALTVPASGAKIFSFSRAGRVIPSCIGAIGPAFQFQPALFSNKIGYFIPTGNGTTVSLLGLNNTTTGTVTTRNVATTNLLTSSRRIGYVSAGAAGSSAGTRHGALQFCGQYGFFFVCRFGMSSAATVATQRSFVGLLSSTAVLPNANPSSNSTIPMLAFGVDSADSSWFFLNGNGTSIVKQTLTGTFPPRDLSISLFEARIFWQAGGSIVYYSLEVMGGSVFNGSVNTNIPSLTTLLSPQVWTNNGTTGSAAGIDVVSIYIETDN